MEEADKGLVDMGVWWVCVTAEACGSSGVKPVGREAEELLVCMNQQQYLFVLGGNKCSVTRFSLSV